MASPELITETAQEYRREREKKTQGSRKSSSAGTSDAGEILRLEYIVETIDLMQSYLDSMRPAVARGNIRNARLYFDCVRTCGKTIGQTLAELEKNGGAP